MSNPTEQPDFNKTIRPHLREMRSRAYSLTKNEADAEDLLQDMLVRAFRFWHTWEAPPDRPNDPRPWLQTVLVRVYCDWYRKLRDRKRALAAHLATVAPSLGHSSSHGVVNAKADRPRGSMPRGLSDVYGTQGALAASVTPEYGTFSDETMAALEGLDPNWREALEAHMDGETREEIAERLSIPRGTVMSRVTRARRAVGRTRAVVELARREFGMKAELPVYNDPYENAPGSGTGRRKSPRLRALVPAAAT